MKREPRSPSTARQPRACRRRAARKRHLEVELDEPGAVGGHAGARRATTSSRNRGRLGERLAVRRRAAAGARSRAAVGRRDRPAAGGLARRASGRAGRQSGRRRWRRGRPRRRPRRAGPAPGWPAGRRDRSRRRRSWCHFSRGARLTRTSCAAIRRPVAASNRRRRGERERHAVADREARDGAGLQRAQRPEGRAQMVDRLAAVRLADRSTCAAQSPCAQAHMLGPDADHDRARRPPAAQRQRGLADASLAAAPPRPAAG